MAYFTYRSAVGSTNHFFQFSREFPNSKYDHSLPYYSQEICIFSPFVTQILDPYYGRAEMSFVEQFTRKERDPVGRRYCLQGGGEDGCY